MVIALGLGHNYDQTNTNHADQYCRWLIHWLKSIMDMDVGQYYIVSEHQKL